MIKEQIGSNIKKWRVSRGFSQESFALKCGLHRTYIASVESGTRNISLENLNKIAVGLEIPLSKLCEYETPIQNTMLLTINGTNFLTESSVDLTSKIKREIEIICQLAYDEDESPIQEHLTDSIYEVSSYDIAGAFQLAIENDLNIQVKFKALNFEVQINE